MYQNNNASRGAGRNSYFSNRNSSGGPRSSYNRSGGRNFSRPRQNYGEKIDVSKFIQKPSFSEETPVEIVNTFSDFHLCTQLESNLRRRNYTTPTPIQDQAINHILAGKDLIGLANTGTGKTAAFLLPLIDKLAKDRRQKVLIIAPTRELAQQIEAELSQFAVGMPIYYTTCVGGLPIYKQINNLRKNPNFVIGTPGRLKDLGKRKVLRFGEFNNIVIDEIDRMLDMGFITDIKEILGQLPEIRQTLVFSATMPFKIRQLIGELVKDPTIVEVKSRETASNVDQDVVRVRDKKYKLDLLQEILSQSDASKVLIFNETKASVEKLATDLIERGFKAESIHGDKKQNQRQRALLLFKNNIVNILVATDVAARGLDIKDITHVINYSIPNNYNDYIHRIGRTGRCNAAGKALTFVESH